MAYNTVKEIQNEARRRKNLRQEKKEKREAKQERIKTILLKNKQEDLPGSNLEGYDLDNSDVIKRLW
jgi:hypothetical protein